MNLNIQIPDNTALIFEYMQKGQFSLLKENFHAGKHTW